ncbi:uncharacterized protein [Argopecten irradians]|uniref:uncharacterized protein n=1 Tax=Argopecten irradians TaxID=31199 RepID=UPI003713DB70
MYSRNRRHRSSTRSLHLSSDNINTSGKHVDTPPRDIYLELITSSRLLDERLNRRFNDHDNQRDRSGVEGPYTRERGGGDVSKSGTFNSFNNESKRVGTDSFIPYGVRSRPPESGKWLAYAKNIKPRKHWEGSNLTKSQSMENIDISSKYPRLQNSNFYQNLHKKYPQAFQRRLPSETKTRRPRRLFNSGLRALPQDEAYDFDDTRSVCSERPMSTLEHDLREFLSYSNPQYDRDCRTSPTPSMMSDLTVKERLNATSDRLYHLLYNGVPQGRYRNSYDPGLTPRSEVTPRARRSRTSSVSSDLHGFDDLDNLSTPRHLDPYHSLLDSSSMSHEEHIRSLQRELEHKDRQLRTYRQKFDLDVAGRPNNSSKLSQDLDSSYTRVISPDSPPDSAIDVDSSSVQSVISMDTRYHHNTDNSTTDVKYSDTSHRNGYLPNNDANYFVNDLDSFALTDVIQEVDEENLAADASGTLASNQVPVDDGQCRTDDGGEDGGTTDSASPIPNASPPKLEVETMMQEMVQQTLSRIPSNGVLNMADGSAGNDLHASPDNDLDASLDNDLHNSHSNNLHTLPNSDMFRIVADKVLSNPANNLDNSPNNDLHISPDNNTADNNLQSSPEKKDVDVQRHNRSQVSLDDDVDDSDPRLGIPDIKTCNESIIQERYQKKCQKIRYHTKRRSVTPRENSAGVTAYTNHSHSENPVSVLCSPRSPNTSLASNNRLQKSKLFQSNQSLNVIGEKPDLQSRRLVSESDIRNVGLENTGIFFSKSANTGSIGSFQSSLSTDTLVASQRTLTEEDLTESYPKISLHSHSPRKKIRFKNIFKGKKGHYNPSEVEANLPVDLETMLKRSSLSDISDKQEVHQNFYSVQYEKSNHHSHQDELEESDGFSESERPQHVHEGAKDPTFVDLSEVKDSNATERYSPVNGGDNADVRPPPPYSKHLEDSQLTAYEAALVNLDHNGLDIDELIESDSDSVFSAKPVVIDSKQKKQNRKPKTQDMDDNTEMTTNQTKVKTKEEQIVEKQGNDSIRSEDEVFTDEDVDVTEEVINNSEQNSKEVELQLKKNDDITRTKMELELPQIKDISASHVDKTDDADVDSNADTLSVNSIPGSGMLDDTPVNSDKDHRCKGPDKDQGSDRDDQGSKEGDDGSMSGSDTESQDPAPVDGSCAAAVVHSDTRGANVKSDTKVGVEGDTTKTVSIESGDNKAKGSKQLKPFSFVAAGSHVDDNITVLDQTNSREPKQEYQREESNLVRSKELSASKQSLSDKAKSKFKAIRKAVSLDKGLNKAGVDNSSDTKDSSKEKKKSGFKMPKIKNPLPFRKKKSKILVPPVSNKTKDSVDSKPPSQKVENNYDETVRGKHPGPVWTKSSCQSLESMDDTPDPGLVNNSDGPRGKLLKLNQDGTQVIQIHKPKHGPVGFFIARGNAQFKHGVFVSRFSDSPQEAMYSGLLCVGDEILEMNKFVLKDLSLDDIYDIMAAKDTLVLTVLPLMARKDV